MKIGVVIGRFQIDQLHEGHKNLLNKALNENDRLLVLLGCPAPACYGGKRNPMDYDSRKILITEEYKTATVSEIFDMKTDDSWSKQVDNKIYHIFPMATEVRLYGGRDSFIPHYKGRHKTVTIEDPLTFSATQRRKDIKNSPIVHPLERKGVIWAREHTWPISKQAVDIAFVKRMDTNVLVLLGRKPGSDVWVFPGGFVDSSDQSLEDAAVRELFEETGVAAFPNQLTYIASTQIKDWRMRKEIDMSIMTAFYKVDYTTSVGTPKAGDDLEEVDWFVIDSQTKLVMADNHQKLMDLLIQSGAGNV